MSVRSAWPLLCLAAFVALPAAAATLTVDAPPGPHEILPGEATSVPFDVTFTASGFLCFQGDDFVVTFVSHDTGVAGMPNLAIPALHFDPGQGVFIEPVGQPYEETKSVSVSLNVDSAVARGRTVDYRYTADFEGGTTCFGTSQPAPASVDFGWQVFTGAPLPTTSTTTGTGPSTEESEGSPAPLGLVVVAVLLAARRR